MGQKRREEKPHMEGYLHRFTQSVDLLAFNPFRFIASVPQRRTLRPRLHKSLLPLKQCSRKTLVLDLDETLVHCLQEPREVVIRPHVRHFLQVLSRDFEIVIFTASQKVYADRVIDFLDPQGVLVKHRLFRDACDSVEGVLLKDLQRLGRDMAHTIILDNSPHAFAYHIDNGIPIRSWIGDKMDRELLDLIPFLKCLVEVPDVRPVLRENIGLHAVVSSANSTNQCLKPSV